MSAAGIPIDLPAGVRSLLSSVPLDCQAKLLDLHKRFQFGEDELDAFLLNAGSLNVDKLPAFQAHLEKERASKTLKKTQPLRSSRSALSAGDSLKKRLAQVALPASAAPAIRAAASGQAEMTTPPAKRAREADGAGNAELGKSADGTPEPLPNPSFLQVSLKSSVNVGNLEKPSTHRMAEVAILGDSKLWTGERHGAYTWMDEAVAERAARRDERLQQLEPAMIAAMQARRPGEAAVAVGTVGVPIQAETVLCGRIVCEGLEGRLNERSMLLEGSRASANSAKVHLTVAECQRIAAFPGQIVSVLGRSGMTGSTFHAREFLAGLPSPSKSLSPERSLHALVVAGPFCLRDGLDYTPLESVLAHAVKERPEVLILLGPFLDANNLKVSSGDTCLPADEEEPCSFEEVYAKHILPLLLRGLSPLRRASPATEVLIVPSLDEVLCFHPLPQPPLDAVLGGTPPVPGSTMDQLKRLGVRFLPNPAHVEINGIKVSLTSADALSPVLREIVLRPEGKKIEEAKRLLLLQRSLFPVVPRDPVQVCEARAAALDFPGDVPDICVFPSISGTANGSLVDDTMFVNPGSLCRPAALGSFAEFWLVPSSSGAKTSLKDRMRVDIHKLG